MIPVIGDLTTAANRADIPISMKKPKCSGESISIRIKRSANNFPVSPPMTNSGRKIPPGKPVA